MGLGCLQHEVAVHHQPSPNPNPNPNPNPTRVDCLTPGQLQMTTELCSADSLPPCLAHVMCSGEALPVGRVRVGIG